VDSGRVVAFFIPLHDLRRLLIGFANRFVEPSHSRGMNAAVSCLVSFLGGIAGAVAGVYVAYLGLGDQGLDALEWAVSFAVFAIIGMVLGAGVAIGLALLVRKRFAKPS
jgi:hypothetical protein